jgi:hypothetical protein
VVSNISSAENRHKTQKASKTPLNGSPATGINETVVQLSDRSYEYACENLRNFPYTLGREKMLVACAATAKEL